MYEQSAREVISNNSSPNIIFTLAYFHNNTSCQAWVVITICFYVEEAPFWYVHMQDRNPPQEDNELQKEMKGAVSTRKHFNVKQLIVFGKCPMVSLNRTLYPQEMSYFLCMS